MTTVRASSMVFRSDFGASIFVGFHIPQGGRHFTTDIILGTGLSASGELFLMILLLVVVLGMFPDWIAILLLAVPIFVPIIKALTGYGSWKLPSVSGGPRKLWFGVFHLTNRQMSSAQPALRPRVVLSSGRLPAGGGHHNHPPIIAGFLGLQTLRLALCILLPGLVLWWPVPAYG